jgi:hypothetical protein
MEICLRFTSSIINESMKMCDHYLHYLSNLRFAEFSQGHLLDVNVKFLHGVFEHVLVKNELEKRLRGGVQRALGYLLITARGYAGCLATSSHK